MWTSDLTQYLKEEPIELGSGIGLGLRRQEGVSYRNQGSDTDGIYFSSQWSMVSVLPMDTAQPVVLAGQGDFVQFCMI